MHSKNCLALGKVDSKYKYSVSTTTLSTFMKYGDAYSFGDTDHEWFSIEPLCEDKLNPTLIHTSQTNSL